MKIVELIEKGVTLIEPDKDKKIGIYYPSEASRCVRQAYYSYFEKPHYDIETQKAFSIGNALHALVQNALELNKDYEVKNKFLCQFRPIRRCQLTTFNILIFLCYFFVFFLAYYFLVFFSIV